MSLRMTDTEKWSKSWFSNLDPDFKNAWNYVNDICDSAGVWDPNFKRADFDIGGSRKDFAIDWQKFRAEAGHRIEVLDDGKWWSVNHISIQTAGKHQSPLSIKEDNYPHRKIIQLLKKHGLIERYSKVELRLFGKSNLQFLFKAGPVDEQGSFELTDELQTTPRRTLAKGIINHLNTKAGRKFSHTPENLKMVEHVLAQVSDDADGLKKMIDRQVERWKGSEYEEYLQPSTLFAKTKWRERYEKRDLPIVKQHANPQTERSHTHF